MYRCALLKLPGDGRYVGDSRPGQLVPHGTRVDFECGASKGDAAGAGQGRAAATCDRGRLRPESAGWASLLIKKYQIVGM